jgi:hypothetical protein
VIRPGFAAFLFALAGCQGADKSAASAPAAKPFAQPAKAAPVAVPVMAPFSVHPDRNLKDMVAGCPGMNPESRPRGSNCQAIFPEQCGADRAAAFQGQELDSSLKEQIAGIAPPGGVRYVELGQPVTQDLRAGRLNIELGGGKKQTVLKVDCY